MANDFNTRFEMLMNALVEQRQSFVKIKESLVEQRKIAEENNKSIARFEKTATEVITEMRDNTKQIKKSIASYIKNESDMVENEINQYVIQYLKKDKRFAKYTIYDLTGKWKFLYTPTISNDKPDKRINKKPITEFDGLFILTTDDDFFVDESAAILVRQPLRSQNASAPKTTFFCVVEAKHSITNKDINEKMNKFKEFQEYVLSCRQDNLTNRTEEYYKTKVRYSLQKLSTELIVIFGSDDMGANQETKIRNEADSWKRDFNISVSFLKPSGDRYELYPFEDGFGRNNLMYKNVQSNSIGARQVKIGAGKTKDTRHKVKK
jgi:mRNA-degrading endonuclease YafQ of YafQ-DinJ toxin-antitoxin module